MQASLPDINTQFIKNKNKALSAAESKNWTGAIGAVYSINALLPEDYQVIISTLQYLDQMKASMVGVCDHCEKEIDNFESIPKFDVILPLTEQLILSSKTSTVWDCPNCKKSNYLEATKTIIRKKQEPNYLKIIPRPPEYKHSFGGRAKYDQLMLDWFWNAINELDHAMMKYRREYKGQDDDPLETLSNLIDRVQEGED